MYVSDKARRKTKNFFRIILAVIVLFCVGFGLRGSKNHEISGAIVGFIFTFIPMFIVYFICNLATRELMSRFFQMRINANEKQRRLEEERERKIQQTDDSFSREQEEDRQYKRQLEKERMRLEMQREVDLKFNIKERIENLKITEQNRKRVAQIESELRNAQGKQLDQLYKEIQEFERLQ